MHSKSVLALACAVWLAMPAAAAADVHLTITNGYVTLHATNATVREILTEWARVGQTHIVNADKLAGPAMTLRLTNEPEDKALKTILRAAGGYVAAPRAVEIANASRFDRILLMPAGPAPTRAAAPPAAFPQPTFAPPPVVDDQDDAPPPNAVMPNVPNVPARGPVFNTYPQPNNVPPPGNAPAEAPPVGVSRPGMVVPSPQQQGQPGQPGQLGPDQQPR
jgi:hypothetical protein